ncbi:MAG: DEAD/DEAH box helicase [Candidatus Methanoperedens sp.]|nr:DEAD/DEAH box helicase [Candidatus Methanoperedens sp.]
MIQLNDFEKIVIDKLERDISKLKNLEQNKPICAPPSESLFIVAGPGSGKTTVIVLKILKLIFVDDIEPSSILAITFTKKAASELRSRILGWGDEIKKYLQDNPSYKSIYNQLERLDFNSIITGTLDSVSEEFLSANRTPGNPSPVVIENFVSKSLMTSVGLFNHQRYKDQNLKDFIADINMDNRRPNISEISDTIQEIKDRLFYDQITINQFRKKHKHLGVPVACDAIRDYIQELDDNFLYDFAKIEQEFLKQLESNTLTKSLKDIKLVLVDEYQDTNLLQEKIYFELTRAAIKNTGSITVVGDDDQSLYRFRGATVDLFQDFKNRIYKELGISAQIMYLSKNYRSTPNIVEFCNKFIVLDKKYQNTRVQSKPKIIPARTQPYTNYTVLGMFRDNVETLASDLAQFIHTIIYQNGVEVQDHHGHKHTIVINPDGGSPADIALLFSSPNELNSGGKPRLPLLLRDELKILSPPIQTFNPRGQNLELIPDVQILCGLILECIDPDSAIQLSIQKLPRDATDMFNVWRNQACNYIDSNPNAKISVNLKRFVTAWQNRELLGRKSGEKDIALADLVYKLVTWIPNMQNDIEGLVYLEAITRTVTQSRLFSKFGSNIIIDKNNPDLEHASIGHAFWNIFAPLATGAIEIDEDLLETLPNDRINIMSIHQAKGLEFPLVIVDVGSDFRQKHAKQEFKRFPTDGGKSCNMEDQLRQHSEMGKPSRLAINRAFDDLIRQYFVAYSRSKDVLLLVGLNSTKDGYHLKSGQQREIPNIATGWDRSEIWHWGKELKNLIHI